MEAEKGSEIKWRFKALEHLVRIHFQLRDFDQMLQVRDGTLVVKRAVALTAG